MDQLYDGASTLVAVCSFFIALCTVCVLLRLYVRWTLAAVGLDDYLFLVGLILWIVSTSFVIPACWNGLGAHVERYTTEQGIAANKYFFLFQHFYVWANIPIKTSLCLTISRIAADMRWITRTIYVIIFTLVVVSLVTNIYLLSDCRPFAANWDKTIPGAVCRPAEGTVALGNAYSAINIFIDWAVALLPVFLLWRVQMRWAQKITVMAVLSLGIFASTATLIRLRTLTNFTNVSDYLFGLGPIVLWTVVELALALVTGSLIAYRPLFKRFFGSTGQSTSNGLNQPGTDIFLQSMRIKSKHHSRLESPNASMERGNREGINVYNSVHIVKTDKDEEWDQEVSNISSCSAGRKNESQQSIIIPGAESR
ncbi:cation-transporting atpase 4 [Fusarium longipes]|uniref:Cation-transporting atpase 4 n=1 Tax=Fusarium longipes TaxID=694270 RepID=A0A395RMI8_9HYPO|nr:cation-transporting atpase 4 [Fusarium longipes]